MKKTKKIAVLFVLFFLILVLVLVLFTQSAVTEALSVHFLKNRVTPEKLLSALGSAVRATQKDDQKKEDKFKKISDEDFKKWHVSEVNNLEVPIKDTISSEKNIKDFVNQLSKNQIEILVQSVLNSESPINDRVFSNYALTLFDGQSSNAILNSLIQSKMPEFKSVQVHSEDEVKRGQEYALRYMQIDSLCMRASDGDRSAKDFLIQIAQQATDFKIQNYAQRKLKEIRY